VTLLTRIHTQQTFKISLDPDDDDDDDDEDDDE
jgi:hypothetical protein